MQQAVKGNLAANTKTIIYIQRATRGVLNQLYTLCYRALTKLKIRFNMNGCPRFSPHADCQLLCGPEQYLDGVYGVNESLIYRIVNVVGGNVEERIIHYTETWYTQRMLDDYYEQEG